MFSNIKIRLKLSDIVLFASLFLAGGFHEHTSCLISLVISIYFLVHIFSQRKIRMQMNLMFVSIASICLFYGLTCLWAIDSGMAFIGFVKYLPVFLYLLLLYQEEREGEVLAILPYVAVGMVLAVGVVAHEILERERARKRFH